MDLINFIYIDYFGCICPTRQIHCHIFLFLQAIYAYRLIFTYRREDQGKILKFDKLKSHLRNILFENNRLFSEYLNWEFQLASTFWSLFCEDCTSLYSIEISLFKSTNIDIRFIVSNKCIPNSFAVTSCCNSSSISVRPTIKIFWNAVIYLCPQSHI